MMNGWGNMMGGWENGGYGHGGYGMMGMVIPLIFGIAIILLGALVFRRNALQVHTGALGKHNTGMNILRERYASGEIDSEEYQSRKKDLEGK